MSLVNNDLLSTAAQAYYNYVATDDGSKLEKDARKSFEFAFATLMCESFTEEQLNEFRDHAERWEEGMGV